MHLHEALQFPVAIGWNHHGASSLQPATVPVVALWRRQKLSLKIAENVFQIFKSGAVWKASLSVANDSQLLKNSKPWLGGLIHTNGNERNSTTKNCSELCTKDIKQYHILVM
jgi:hypothetical protein